MSEPLTKNPENEPGFNTAMVELHTATSDDRAWSPEWADEKMRPRLYEALSILGRALDRERARAEKAEARLKELENDYGGNVSLNLRIQELEAALAAAVKERDAWRRGDDENADGKHACPEDAFDEARRLRAEAEGRDA